MARRLTSDRYIWLAIPALLLMHGAGLPIGLLVAEATTGARPDWSAAPEIGAYVAIFMAAAIVFGLIWEREAETVSGKQKRYRNRGATPPLDDTPIPGDQAPPVDQEDGDKKPQSTYLKVERAPGTWSGSGQGIRQLVERGQLR